MAKGDEANVHIGMNALILMLLLLVFPIREVYYLQHFSTSVAGSSQVAWNGTLAASAWPPGAIGSVVLYPVCILAFVGLLIVGGANSQFANAVRGVQYAILVCTFFFAVAQISSLATTTWAYASDVGNTAYIGSMVIEIFAIGFWAVAAYHSAFGLSLPFSMAMTLALSCFGIVEFVACQSFWQATQFNWGTSVAMPSNAWAGLLFCGFIIAAVDLVMYGYNWKLVREGAMGQRLRTLCF